MSGERAFSFSRSVLKTAGAGAGAQDSRTALRILYKSSSEYLGTLVATGDFSPGVPSDCLETSESGGREEPGRATEGATEGSSWQERLRPWTEIILKLKQDFFLITLF